MAKKAFSALSDDKGLEDQIREKDLQIKNLEAKLENSGGVGLNDRETEELNNLIKQQQELIAEKEEEINKKRNELNELLVEKEYYKESVENIDRELREYKEKLPGSPEEIRKELEKLKTENTQLSKKKSEVIIERVWRSDLSVIEKKELLKDYIGSFGNNLYSLLKEEVHNLEEATETIHILRDLGDTLKGSTNLFIGKVFSDVTKNGVYKDQYSTIEEYANSVFGISYDKMVNYRDAWDYFFSKKQNLVPVQDFDLSKIRLAIPVLKMKNIVENVKNEIIEFVEIQSPNFNRNEFQKKFKEKIKEIEKRDKIKFLFSKEKDLTKKRNTLEEKVKLLLQQLTKESLINIQKEVEKLLK